MLEFFRQYQRYFYLIITVVIIISFSFFGTYNTLNNNDKRDTIAFTAVDGTKVTRGELEQFAQFIGTDASDKLIFGGIWGPNFLNDGVVRKEFLQTGLAQKLYAAYTSDLGPDLESRHQKEKRYTPYTHPQLPLLSAESAWSYFVPEMRGLLQALKVQNQGSSPEAFDLRVSLYLTQTQFPPSALQQVLRYQQRQYGLQPDPNIEYADFSLFGYHTLDDWFGPRFIKIVAEFILNTAKIAEQRGYRVTKEEALADLMHHAELSYRDNSSNPHLDVANSSEYFHEQLNRLSLDQNKAALLWRQVLLFRRLFQDAGQDVFVDPFSLQPFVAYTKASVQGELYQLPPNLRFNNLQTLQKFEAYLNAISQRTGLLALPKTFLPVSTLLKDNPELVQKRYLLDVAEVNKNSLQGKMSIKETWNWEVDEANWALLKEKFGDLKNVKAETREDRFAALDHLSNATRAQVDSFARQTIIDQHPEWLDKALQEAEPKRMSVTLFYKGGSLPLTGVKNAGEFMQLLDRAPLGEQSRDLVRFSGDNQVYYKIVVVDRSKEAEIATFAEALKNNTFNSSEDQKVKNDRAALHQAIYEAYAAGIAPQKPPAQLIEDVAASLRLYSYMQEALTQLKQNPKSASHFVQPAKEETNDDPNKIAARAPLEQQWLLLKGDYTEARSGRGNMHEFFAMQPGTWSSIQTPVTGDLSFFKLERVDDQISPHSMIQGVASVQTLLSEEAQGELMKQILEEIQAKNGISLEFMKLSEEG